MHFYPPEAFQHAAALHIRSLASCEPPAAKFLCVGCMTCLLLNMHVLLGLQDKDATVRMRALSSVHALADRLWEAESMAPHTDGGACAIVQIAPLLADRRGSNYSVALKNISYTCPAPRHHVCMSWVFSFLLGFTVCKQADRAHVQSRK